VCRGGVGVVWVEELGRVVWLCVGVGVCGEVGGKGMGWGGGEWCWGWGVGGSGGSGGVVGSVGLVGW